MRIDRDSWRVMGPACPAGVCLIGLAARGGYRVREICVELGCGERYFRRVFVRDVGVPPKSWLQEQRIRRAHALLAAGEKVERLAAELGFASCTGFLRAFRECEGTTVRAWLRAAAGSPGGRQGADAGPLSGAG